MRTPLATFALGLAACSAPAQGPRIAFILAEREYGTATTVPAFFEAELEPLGFRASYVTAPGSGPGRDDLEGLPEALAQADLLFVSARRRAPKKAQMKALRTWVAAGKPVVGIRTASHAFSLRGKAAPQGHAMWGEWDAEVFGGSYSGHHGAGKKTWFQAIATAKGHPILDGVQAAQELGSGGSLYEVLPLGKTTEVLAMGRAEGIDELQPVAWTNQPARGHRIFYTSLGHARDFERPAFRLLLLNAIHWALEREVPGKLGETRPPEPARLPELKTPGDLELELVLREPEVANPLYIDFDERGRLWLVEYRQYPWPAGLRLVSHDKVYRNVYDPPYPPPPPHPPGSPFRGKDRISIHEDTNGDGDYDSHKIFLDGLSLATAALKGRGGVFVLNPPYLLFYADRNEDDVPDSLTPRVLLSGFGLEDSHSITNNLRWGPDGWIYATHGSTVTAKVVLHGADNQPLPGFEPIRRMGQFVWRYHPESHRFEIFAEGGGNAFGVEIDAKGRLYSGHNGGNTRGFHYVQGGYYRKTFGKHGELSNPYAFGHFPAMAHPKVKRFTHTFEIYEGTILPERYHGKLFGASPVLRYVVASELRPHGSTFQTQDIDLPITIGDDPDDRWFSPVDIQTGLDGNLYVADFHDRQVAHYIAYSKGLTDPGLGRIYRLKARGTKPIALDDAFSAAKLLQTALHHPQRRHRETALRLLGDREDAGLVPSLREALLRESGQAALQALWAIHLCGGFDEALAAQALGHQDPHVRRWTVRLLGDRREISAPTARKFAALAGTDADVEVRSQLAATARRLSAGAGLPILAHLARRAEDAGDPHLPLLIWWGYEAHARDHEAMIAHFETLENWRGTLRADGALPQQNLMRRWALSGTQEELEACARLLELAPDARNLDRLMKGFEKAFDGRPLPPLPPSLTRALSRARGQDSLLLAIRKKDRAALTEALSTLQDDLSPLGLRIQLSRVLGDVAELRAIPVLLGLISVGKETSLRREALLSLQKFDRPEIGKAVLATFADLPETLRGSALHLLASRAGWARDLVEAIDAGRIPREALDMETLAKLRLHPSPKLRALLDASFGADVARSDRELDRELTRYREITAAGGGNPKTGESLFFGKAGCGACHSLFARGGRFGPDLTPYDRSDLDAMLLAIVRPDAEIREGYENYILTTDDGRILSGFKTAENPQVLILRGLDGQDHLVPHKSIASLVPAGRSLMPTGLLDALDAKELGHLFAYLASTTPPK